MTADQLFLVLVVAFIGWRLLSSYRARQRIPQLMKEGAQLVDVRSPAEFASGHVPGSVNIPLNEIDQGAARLDKQRWVIVFCASGTRSAMARRQLLSRGFERVLNAGTWRNVNGAL